MPEQTVGRETARFALAKRWAGLVASHPAVGRLIGRVLHERIPHRGLVIDVSDPAIAPKTKTALLLRGYESAETRMVQRWLPRDCPVVELGGSIGVLTCLIRRHLASGTPLISVEADPHISALQARTLTDNGCDKGVTQVRAAVAYGASQARFGKGAATDGGAVCAEAEEPSEVVEVPAITLGALLRQHALDRYSLVCDIEGMEWAIVQQDFAALEQAEFILMETHDAGPDRSWRELVKLLADSPKFDLVDQYGPVVALRRREPGRG